MKIILAVLVVFAVLVAVQLALKSLAPTRTQGRIQDPAGGGAKVMWDEAERLSRDGAHWQDIIASLNQENDPRVRDLLFEIRGSNMFVAGAGLELICAGCRKALEVNNRAGALDALQAAKVCMSMAKDEAVG